MTSALEDLVERARGPLGPRVALDFGVDSGPLKELSDLLSRVNGFFAFDAGIQVFRVGDEGLGPELIEWNSEEAWKETYGSLADQVFCFGQDLLGTQFAIVGGDTIVTFDPETAETREIGKTLDAWATWLFGDPAVHATANLAYAWQKQNGPLEPDQRLIPLAFFVAGGGYEFDNLVVRDAVTAMRIRGPIAQQITGLPDGANIRLHLE
ncbi:SMI1/KNR4 family protein [Streptomyces montanus]|uniref:SMI1/KNR4 family protein n=1 Tax=Streptomyces montanus TaxID=2580423 RepID=A0A5R9FDV4_9ACTN|nr:SMI1/KNR4 family protein [Streptomyces montanus]TLS41952.1 SMI1/KNR4 family protein [Streptomyces montanus]